jgi:hypothetical protein
MAKKQSNWIVIMLLIVALIYLAITFWPNILGRKDTGPAQPVTAAAPEPKLATVEAVRKIRLSREMNLGNPFARRVSAMRKSELEKIKSTPPVEPTKPIVPVLEGVWVDSGMRVAFISGQTILIGGRVLGWRVVEILKDQVVLEKGGAYKTLKMEALR